MLMDLLRPTSGSATILGLDSHLDSRETRRRIGYLSGNLALYDNLTGVELLEYASHLRGGVEWSAVETLMTRLECEPNQPIRSLSRGNKQKLGLVQALMHQPELMIFDEPTNGLDPLVQQEFYRLIAEVKAAGRTVFLSSHNLPEVERVCDRVGFIRQGRLVAVEDIATLKARASSRMELRFAVPVPKEAFANLSGVRALTIEDRVVRCSVTGSMDAIIKAAARFEILDVISHEPNLEDIFLEYYGEAEDHAA
jgi:ABC-2 type transport system ATP-binding protein